MAHSISEPPAGRGRVDPGTATMPRTAARSAWDFWAGEGQCATLERYGALVARFLLSQIFLVSGVSKILTWNGMLGYTQASFDRFFGWLGAGPETLTGLHGAMPILLGLAAATEIVFGLSVLLGFRARLGALVLFLFLIPATLVFHSFWTYPEAQHQAQMINFMKNLAIMGGLWMVLVFGPGFCSLDALKWKQEGHRGERLPTPE